MIQSWKQRKLARKWTISDRQRLLSAVGLAQRQWQYGLNHLDEDERKFDVVRVLERRYMFLYQVVKKRKIHLADQKFYR
jgi:hypothetical protein